MGEGALKCFPVALKPLAGIVLSILGAAFVEALPLEPCEPLILQLALTSMAHAALLTSIEAGSP